MRTSNRNQFETIQHTIGDTDNADKMCSGNEVVRWPRSLPASDDDNDSVMVVAEPCPPHRHRRRHRSPIVNKHVNSQCCIRDSLFKSSLYKLTILIWLVINVNVNVVVCDVEQLYAIPDDYQWTNGGADVAAAVAADSNNNNDIDSDQPMMIIYDEEFDVTDDDSSTAATMGRESAATTTTTMSTTTTETTTTTTTTTAAAPEPVIGHFTSTWAVHIPSGDDEANRVAAEHGFTNLGKVRWKSLLF